ncbi:MAG TPA: hypothetical protein VD794_03875 [Flavisolibacter sp.]|nr:hypothetical protein [Flavisolibacter sp.]
MYTSDVELTDNNLDYWKQKLAADILSLYGLSDYAETCSDEEWLDMYRGYTVAEAISSEVEGWAP